MYPFVFIAASFYGSGSVTLPMQDAQSTTDLSFRFRTARSEALLVLVAGRTDYCLVMLQAGTIKVSKNKQISYQKLLNEIYVHIIPFITYISDDTTLINYYKSPTAISIL